MQAGSQITLSETLLCAGLWGAWGRTVGTSPCLLEEDLLVANTDLDYVTTVSCQESSRRGSVGGSADQSPKLAFSVREYHPSPNPLCHETPKIGLANPFPGAYKNCLEACFAVHWS